MLLQLHVLLLCTARPFDITLRGLIDHAHAIGSVRAAVEAAAEGADSVLDESFFLTLKSRHSEMPEDADLRAVMNAFGEIYSMPELVKPTAVDQVISLHWTTAAVERDEEAELTAIDNQLGVESAGSQNSGYGEVTRDGTRALFLAMGLTKKARRATPAVFYDFGSGYGRLVAQAWLELAPKEIISRSVGVELASARHNAAVHAWESLRASGDAQQQCAAAAAAAAAAAGEPEFILGSMLETDLSQATHVYVASLVFDEALVDAVWQVLLRNAPRLELVASLRKFPNAGPPDGVVKVAMNWNDACPVYLYRRGTAATVGASSGASANANADVENDVAF